MYKINLAGEPDKTLKEMIIHSNNDLEVVFKKGTVARFQREAVKGDEGYFVYKEQVRGEILSFNDLGLESYKSNQDISTYNYRKLSYYYSNLKSMSHRDFDIVEIRLCEKEKEWNGGNSE